jgi:peptidoglycan/LPS O-acetylase OafA/YrhL
MKRPSTSHHVELLDCGRLVAAVTVLMFHYFYNGVRNGKIVGGEFYPQLVPVAMYGYLGVDLFFMISGYVIFFSANGRTAREFIVSRLLRIFPAFWGAVVITTTVAQFLGTGETSVTARQALANLTLYPGLFHQSFVDGVYWTLIYEVQFYALVAFLLCTPFRNRLKHLALFWPFAIAIAQGLGYFTLPYLSPVHSFFAAGAVFAALRSEKSALAFSSLAVVLCLCIAGAIDNTSDPNSIYHRSPLVIAALIAAMFAFFAVANMQWSINARIPGSAWAGKITYPLYLVHAHIGYMLLSVLGTSPPAYALVITTAFLIAIALHLSVEIALRDFWRTLFTKAVGLIPFLPSGQSGRPFAGGRISPPDELPQKSQ